MVSSADEKRPGPSSSRSHIQQGHNVLFLLPSGEIKSVRVGKNRLAFSSICSSLPLNLFVLFSTISFGKYGSFNSDALVGQPYGLTYDIIDKKLKVLPPKTMDELGAPPQNSLIIFYKLKP